MFSTEIAETRQVCCNIDATITSIVFYYNVLFICKIKLFLNKKLSLTLIYDALSIESKPNFKVQKRNKKKKKIIEKILNLLKAIQRFLFYANICIHIISSHLLRRRKNSFEN